MSVTFVTGNAKKAKYFAELIGMPVNHHSADTQEIQSLDLKEVAALKAKQAFEQLRTPVIVEDVSLVIDSMGKLPGPFIKWFIEELGLEKLCRLADADKDRKAIASCVYAYYDGEQMAFFESSLEGKIADKPRGDSGFGWNPTFIPSGTNQTLGEMDDKTFKKFYLKVKPIEDLKQFLHRL